MHSLVWAQRTATVHLWLWPGWRRAPGTRHRPLPPRSSTGLCCWHSHTESQGGGSTRRSSLLQGPFAGSTNGLEGVKGWRWGEAGGVPGTNCSCFSLVALQRNRHTQTMHYRFLKNVCGGEIASNFTPTLSKFFLCAIVCTCPLIL